MSVSLNKIINGIRIVDIVPIEAMGERWYCIGFEKEEENLGDNIHLLFAYNKNIRYAKDLLEMLGTFYANKVPLLRIHSECLLGDIFKSDLCDCGEQLNYAFESISNYGVGGIIYLRQEGRGIGLRAKLACLSAQEGYEAGRHCLPAMSPDEANVYKGFRVDEREYSIVPKILRLLNVKTVTLLTSNHQKIAALTEGGITINSLDDISREEVMTGSRKYIELREKATRHYSFKGLDI